MKHPHYFKSVKGLDSIDVYRLLELFEVTCPVAQHIVKKALAAGKRGAKNRQRDMQDIVDSAERWLEMRAEDNRREFSLSPAGIYNEEPFKVGSYVPWPGSDLPVSGPVEFLLRSGDTKYVPDVASWTWSIGSLGVVEPDIIGWRHPPQMIVEEIEGAVKGEPGWAEAPQEATHLVQMPGTEVYLWAKEVLGCLFAEPGGNELPSDWPVVGTRDKTSTKELAESCCAD